MPDLNLSKGQYVLEELPNLLSKRRKKSQLALSLWPNIYRNSGKSSLLPPPPSLLWLFAS